jgi:hypothetical protein
MRIVSTALRSLVTNLHRIATADRSSHKGFELLKCNLKSYNN